jgi:hypothetical protein
MMAFNSCSPLPLRVVCAPVIHDDVEHDDTVVEEALGTSSLIMDDDTDDVERQGKKHHFQLFPSGDLYCPAQP